MLVGRGKPKTDFVTMGVGVATAATFHLLCEARSTFVVARNSQAPMHNFISLCLRCNYGTQSHICTMSEADAIQDPSTSSHGTGLQEDCRRATL